MSKDLTAELPRPSQVCLLGSGNCVALGPREGPQWLSWSVLAEVSGSHQLLENSSFLCFLLKQIVLLHDLCFPDFRLCFCPFGKLSGTCCRCWGSNRRACWGWRPLGCRRLA